MAALNLKKLAQKAAKTQDLTKESTGGDYSPPEKGVPGLRFVGYIETGKVNGEFKGKPKVTDKATLLFELHGKRWPVGENGNPTLIAVKLNKGTSAKSQYIKLFKAMNYAGNATTFVELLGDAFIGNISHYEGNDGKTYATLKDDATGVFTVRAPFTENEDGESIARKVPEALSDIKCFLWNDPDKDQWDSIFIDGEYDDGTSKNKFQKAIRDAVNFEGSPIEALLEGAPEVEDDDVEDAKAAAKAKKAAAAKQAAEDDDEDEGAEEREEEEQAPPPAKTAAKKAPPAAKAKPKAAPKAKPAADEDDPMGDIPDGEDD